MLPFLTLGVSLGLCSLVQSHSDCLWKSKPPYRIDTHAHYIPAFWKQEAIQYGLGQPDGIEGLPDWTVEAHLQMMAKANITKSILSITSPGVNFDVNNVTQARSLARRVNEYASSIKKKYPKKFGFWAVLPLPDVEGTLAEIDYALDTLNADGFGVLTNVHGVYLGDDTLKSVFKALNTRNATIFVHPTSPCGTNGTFIPALPQWPNPMYEFFFDTARTVTNMILKQTLLNSPNITIILSHVGGAFPPLVARIAAYAALVIPSGAVNLQSIKNTLQTQFYFDTAGFSVPDQVRGVLAYVNSTRLTYGSDYPMTGEAAVLGLAGIFDEELPSVFPDCRDQKNINIGNAQRLLEG